MSRSMVACLAALSVGSVLFAAAITAAPEAHAVEAVRYEPPVAAAVVDGFRPPSTRYGRGNRGLEYATRPGDGIRAAGRGRVRFAGRVGGWSVVSIDHADGLRTTYSGLALVSVERGQTVDQGHTIGTAAGNFHFGVRAGRSYLDPAALFDIPDRVHLAPTARRRVVWPVVGLH